MILRSKPNSSAKVSIRQLMNNYEAPPPSRFPPPHIESESQESSSYAEKQSKSTQRRRKKIFQIPKMNRQSTFNRTSNLIKNLNSTEETSPHFTNSWMVKDQGTPPPPPEPTFGMKKQSKRCESSEPFFPFKASMSPPPKQQIQNTQNKKIEDKFEELKIQLNKHDCEIKQLNEKFERKCQKDSEVEKKMYDQIKKGEKHLYQKETNLHQYLDKIQVLQSENQLKKQQLQRYELQIERAKRIEQLVKENEKLYQGILKNQTKTQDETGQLHFRDQNYNSISALHPNKNEEDSFDNGTIGELLSPFAINPHDL